MALYSVSAPSTATVTVAPIATLWAGAGKRLRLKELGVFCNAATASAVALYRATNTPAASTTAVGQGYDTTDLAATGLLGTVWSTAPTVSALLGLRRVQLPAAIGAGVIWQFDDLVVGPAGTSSLVLWNHGGTTNSVLQIYAVWDE